jgi:membrane protein
VQLTRRLGRIRRAVSGAYGDILNNHAFTMAAGLSYYFVLSLFPLLILLAALVTFLPIPHLFDRILGAMGQVVPPDSMGVVRGILKDVISASSGALLSFGFIATLWSASGGFVGMIDALNVAYDVHETRPLWKTRLLAIGLTFAIGALMVTSLGVMIVGPRFGEWLAHMLYLDWAFALAWPTLRWVIAVGLTVLAVEVIYYVAPNVKQRFRCTLPGAVLAVGVWLLLSELLGVYFRDIADVNATYGTLGGAIALMIWFYWSALAILVGAELNSELLKAAGERLPVKEPEPQEQRVAA